MKTFYKRIRHSLKLCLNKYVLIPFVYSWTAKLKILPDIESIQYVIEHHCSLSRFGDGEFDIIKGHGNGFQSPDDRLAKRLMSILMYKEGDIPNYMIGIPLPIKVLPSNRDPYAFWPNVAIRHFTLLRKCLDIDQVYLNTQMTRFYFEKENKSNCAKQLSLLKKIWQNRKILIVEGCQTRSGVGNDLYNNAGRIRRILCPAINAFTKYDEILSTIKFNLEQNELILLSLGMTATVLAYDLAKEGFWAIDIGHVDLEYEWFKIGKNERSIIKGKFVQEVENGNIVEECYDSEYLSQVIARIGC